MLHAPNMLMVGATGRKAGKTEFICGIIRHHASQWPVVAIKITTLDERARTCPRGEAGCGVSGSLQGNYRLTEETAAGTGKDTARMREAGAKQVLWLCVRRAHMAEAVAELLCRIPRGSCVVCESNSAREALVPGAFVVVRGAAREPVKESCAAVLDEADRVLGFDGSRWDCPPERCRFDGGRWSVPMEASAVVLVGGQSRRMGRDKSLIPFGGRTLLEHVLDQIRPLVDETLVGGGSSEQYGFAGLSVISDEVPGQGPLMGIASCVQAARGERVLVTACDIPELPADLLRMMLRRARHAGIVMPRGSSGRYEPLMAVYTKRCLPAIRAVLARGGRRVVDVLDEPGVQAEFVELPPGDWYHNMNTPDEYRRVVGHDLI